MAERKTAYEARSYISEKALAQSVVDYARLKGWTVWRTWRSDHSPAGEPDLRLIRPPRVIFAELKAERGRLGDHQKRARQLLEQCPGVEYHLWRPSDWPGIERVLA